MNKLLPGVNDLSTVRPNLTSEWDCEKNSPLCPSDIHAFSNKKYWWRCKRNHSWLATPNNRSNGYGCPYCSGRRAIKGETDLASCFPELLSEWDYEKNSVDPSSVTKKSNKSYWWKCKEGHSWKDKPYHRLRGDNCPFCSGHRVLQGFNDLASLNPTLSEDWNYERNKPLLPSDVTVSSNKKVWWKCKDGHEWKAPIARRNGQRTGCPYCSGRLVIPGETDLLSVNPLLSEEWNYEKNSPFRPENILANSTKDFWWKCTICHYEWKAKPYNRNKVGLGCPNCHKRNRTSFPEQAIFFYVKQYYSDTINSYLLDFSNQMELDIYIPSRSIGIEYDGIMHKGKVADEKKYLICQQKGITLIRVSELSRESPESLCDIMIPSYYLQHQNGGLDETLKRIMKTIGISDLDICTERDKMLIYAQYLTKLRDNSLSSVYPDIAREWHPNKNGDMFPDMFNWGSSTKVWWRCSKGHEWQTTIASRTSNGAGCPICGRKKVKAGQLKIHLQNGANSLETVRPDLAAEWNYRKNKGIDISLITPHSNQKVWWKCSKGHEWQAIVTSRSYGTGCSVCANQKIIRGINDLYSSNPEVATLWNYKRNTEVEPYSIAAHSNKRVWWICNKNHEWQAVINSVVSGRRCPVCAGRKVASGFNDLATLQPALMSEWDYEKNKDLRPDQVAEHSGKKAWWKCPKGHSWYAVIDSRSKGIGCPECASHKKAVVNLDTNQVFTSLIEAAKSCGLASGTSISDSIKKRKTAGGFHWEFCDVSNSN